MGAVRIGRRRLTLLKLFTVGISGLAALGLSLALWAFLEDLYARTPVLGWVAIALAVLAVVGAVPLWLLLRRLPRGPFEHPGGAGPGPLPLRRPAGPCA